jgi:hypothetical protein
VVEASMGGGWGAVSRTVPMRLTALAIVAVGVAACSSAVPHPSSKQPHRGHVIGTLATLGSPGNPLMLSCDQTSNSGPQKPRPGDLVVGPLWIINGRDSVDPNGAGPHPQHGYKYPIAVTPGATVTMMIAPRARGHVVIDNPYGPSGVVAATYKACQPSFSRAWSVFVQSFTFTDGRARGCVPLTVLTGRKARIRYITVSLYAGTCAP